MVIFNKIRWKNFLSTGNSFIEIQLDKSRTTLIVGENGSGKTTLLDAITFVLFAKPYRNINIPQLVNSINEKDCVVEIEFVKGENNYKIVRGLAPKLFEVYKDGLLIDQNAKSKDYQKMVEDVILKMNYKSFCQVVILGSTNYVPFMRLASADRREIVEDLLDISVFSTMNTVLKGKISKAKEDIKDLDYKVEIERQKSMVQQRNIKLMTSRSQDQIKKHEQEILDSEKIIADLESQIEDRQKHIQVLMDELELLNVDEEVKSLEYAEKSVNNELNKIHKDIQFYHKNDACPVCTQKIDITLKNNIVNEKQLRKTELEQLMEAQKIQLDKINEIIKIKTMKLSNVGSTEKEIQGLQSQASATAKYIKKIQTGIDELKVDNTSIDTEKEKLKDIAILGKTLLENKNKLNDDMHYFSLASLLIKDTGIKSKIIKYYLPIMNKIINKYLAQMDFFVQFELSESFEETIKSRHRDIFTYNSFSEGEKRKIDLSLLFAWRAVSQLKNSLNCNLLIFDEVLDGSLDDASTESFLTILKGFQKNINIYVISHKPKDILQDKFEDHITYRKKNNFTKIEQ